MGAKSVPLSVRLPQADAEYIAGLKAGDAVTMSEKVRFLVGEARRYAEEGKSFEGLVKQQHGMLEPLEDAIAKQEGETGETSALLKALIQYIPTLVASLEAVEFNGNIDLKATLSNVEAEAANLTKAFLDQLARLAVTEEAPCMNPSVARDIIEPLDELFTLKNSAPSGA
ncbi:hypothetical protein [Kordiimonas laminariae]|uniref:hypothetical protein n=1 Tax=Kordiimonas laminariae TaxID=2917717 RepID=UPI001FF5ACCA|nr:hypothetical protein [Kordiimonas laminariae]MCK0068080.1 hypothetical protein [Kordiimonas laminariae]